MGRTQRETSIDTGALYLTVHREFARLLDSLTPAQLQTVVPAAPQWCVRDVAAHVVGLAAALNAQHLPAADDEGGTAWAAGHIAARAETSVPELLAEWDREAPAFADGLRLFGYEFGCHFVADLLVHMHDVQAALGLPPYADPVALVVALDHYCDHLGGLLAAAGWGMVVVDSSDGEVRSVGVGAERARVAGSPYDLLRSFSARRSERQVRSLAWTGDVDAFVAFLRDCWSGGYSLPLADQP
ncbi:MAG: maleylpyruvate isomerase N-terminal domain-containing protein [Actinomycetota bacterium]|nr:maleylpyruvate isomerase N-terminal domain-containing protein [Actinomycetota bacterium]